jgi:hypothetical protein
MNRADRITPEARERLLAAYAKLPRSPSGKRVENGLLAELAEAHGISAKYLKSIIGEAKRSGHPSTCMMVPYETASKRKASAGGAGVVLSGGAAVKGYGSYRPGRGQAN